MENIYLIILIVVLSLLVGGLVFGYRLRGFRETKAMRKRFERGAEGECIAAVWLRRHGFRIIRSQAKITRIMKVDGRSLAFTLKADFLVRKKRRLSVVEVKTGSLAPDPSSSDTRRQLFEYAAYYNADSVYLFDAEKKVLSLIDFPDRIRTVRCTPLCFMVGLIAGVSVSAGIYIYTCIGY